MDPVLYLTRSKSWPFQAFADHHQGHTDCLLRRDVFLEGLSSTVSSITQPHGKLFRSTRDTLYNEKQHNRERRSREGEERPELHYSQFPPPQITARPPASVPFPALFLGPRGSRSTLNAKTQLDVLVHSGLIVQDKVAPKQQLLATNETNHD